MFWSFLIDRLCITRRAEHILHRSKRMDTMLQEKRMLLLLNQRFNVDHGSVVAYSTLSQKTSPLLSLYKLELRLGKLPQSSSSHR